MFCGPKTADVSRGRAEGNMAVEGSQNMFCYIPTIKEEQKAAFKYFFYYPNLRFGTFEITPNYN